MDDRLVARVDLKADRQGSRLLARRIGFEPDSPSEAAERLAAELHLMARWLELDSVEISGQARSTSATLSR